MLYSCQLEYVANLLNTQHEKCLNIGALKELMHRCGLNIRFLWLLMPKVKLKKSRELLMVAILIRIMRRIVN